jgi:hypothetical protein
MLRQKPDLDRRGFSITSFEGSHLQFGGGRGRYGESNLTPRVERSSAI